MRLLIVGADEVHAIENFYFNYIRAIGVDVRLLPARRIFNEYYYRNILNKLKYKLGVSDILKRINLQFKATVESFNPEIIFIFKGMELSPESLTWVRARNIKLVNYNPDNPFLFSGKGSGNKNITESIGLYDLHFTYNSSIREQLEREYAIPVAYLPFGFDVSENCYEEARQQQENVKLCFLGNPDESRASFIRSMAGEGLSFDIYGNDWHRFIDHPNVKIHPPVYGADFWKTLHRYRVQLNLMRQHNPDSHNMRSFEVPGIGGILLAPFTPEHQLFFTEGKEAFFYRDVHEAVSKARRLLALTEEEARHVRLAARERSLSSGYTYRDRAVYAYGKMEELLNG